MRRCTSDELSWIFTVEGAVTLTDTDSSPVPSGIPPVAVTLKLIWAFAPRGTAMRTALKALPDDLKEGSCSAEDGDSCADGRV